MAAYRNVYTPPETSFPLDDKPDVDSDVELFGEEAVKEKRVIESNRLVLISQYAGMLRAAPIANMMVPEGSRARKLALMHVNHE